MMDHNIYICLGRADRNVTRQDYVDFKEKFSRCVSDTRFESREEADKFIAENGITRFVVTEGFDL